MMSADYECETCHRPGDEHTAMCANYDALQARVRELQELVGDLQEENTRLDRELEYAQQVTIPYLEQERNALQEYIAKQPDAEASITRLERDNAALRAELDRLHKAEQERDLWEHRSSRFESGLPSPNDD